LDEAARRAALGSPECSTSVWGETLPARHYPSAESGIESAV
jgi:hypothetical protein